MAICKFSNGKCPECGKTIFFSQIQKDIKKLTNEKGVILNLNNGLYQIEDCQHCKEGKNLFARIFMNTFIRIVKK